MATEQNLWPSFHVGNKGGKFSNVTDEKDTWNIYGSVTLVVIT
jgi:hypothetical protein